MAFFMAVFFVAMLRVMALRFVVAVTMIIAMTL